MLNAAEIGSLPKTGSLTGFFAVPNFLQGFIRRAIDMKLGLKHLSLPACKNHLGLDRRMVQAIDGILTEVGGTKKSVAVQVGRGGGIGWSPTDNLFWLNGKKLPGVSIRYSGIYGTENAEDCLLFGAPWAVLRKGAPGTGHCVYQVHTASSALFVNYQYQPDGKKLVPMYEGKPLDLSKGKQLIYVGKTSCGVAVRFLQHLRAAGSGSMTKFYQVMRGLNGYQAQLPIGVFVVGQYASEDMAYDAEERMIEEEAGNHALGLLNTAGSRECFRDLIAHDSAAKKLPPEYAEERLAMLKAQTAANWDDPSYAESVICNNPNNFDYFDISSIRLMHGLGKGVKEIAKYLGHPTRRVRGVLDGRTYSRVI